MPPSTPFVLALPAETHVATFAEECRAAALEFVNRVARGGDKEQLAAWLGGPYRAHSVTLARSHNRRLGAASVVPGALAALLERTRREVGAVLRVTRDAEDGVAFGFSALAAGHVYRCQDAEGVPGWVPVAQPRMRLADRVLSLIAADYLLRGDDYETALYACSICGFVAFDASRAAHRTCPANPRSDVRELSPGYAAIARAG